MKMEKELDADIAAHYLSLGAQPKPPQPPRSAWLWESGARCDGHTWLSALFRAELSGTMTLLEDVGDALRAGTTFGALHTNRALGSVHATRTGDDKEREWTLVVTFGLCDWRSTIAHTDKHEKLAAWDMPHADEALLGIPSDEWATDSATAHWFAFDRKTPSGVPFHADLDWSKSRMCVVLHPKDAVRRSLRYATLSWAVSRVVPPG